MIERGRIVAIEQDAYWVETINASSCGSCTAQKACGQGLLAAYFEGRPNHLRVLMGEPETRNFTLHDEIEFDVADRVLLSSAFLVYTLPLIGMLLVAAACDATWQHPAAAPLGALTGFLLGLLPARVVNVLARDDRRLQPVVLGPARATRPGDTAPT